MKSRDLLVKIILGNLLIALAVTLFIIPNQLVSGGSTGLVLTLTHFTGLEFSFLTAIVNIVAFAAGWLVLGRTFALTTLLSTLLYPVTLKAASFLLGGLILTQDALVAAVMAGVLMGLGLGLVIGAGGSTGGMDIPVIIANRKLGVSVSAAMYIMDTCILASQMLYSPFSNLVYGIILIAATTLTINQVVLVGKSECQIFVISEKKEAIRETIISKLDKGATLVKIETGYQRKETSALLCVVSHRNLHQVQKAILDIDPYAFMTVSKIQEVNGRGFSLDKHLKVSEQG